MNPIPLRRAVLYLLVAIASFAHAYISELKLVACDPITYACATYPGYRRIPVDLNQGATDLPTIYLDLKDDPQAPPITAVWIGPEQKPLGTDWVRLAMNLNQGSPDDAAALYLQYTKSTTVSPNPITSIIVKRGAHPVVSAEYTRIPVDLNKGVHGEPVFMFIAQEGPKDPITAISARQCFSDDCYMEGWHRVEKDVNEGVVVGLRVYLFYQRIKGQPPVRDVVVVLNDQSTHEGYTKVDVDLNAATFRGASIHLWYKTAAVGDKGDASELEPIQELAIEYGQPSITPFGWTRIPVNLNGNDDGQTGFGEATYLFYRRGYPALPTIKPLAFHPDGKFKILQLADLHFTNENGVCRDVAVDMDCRGDQTTIDEMGKLLDLEKPDLVVFSGDNVNGEGVVSDARAATFKFAAPVIDRNIPWAAIFGNHDDENDLTREELLTVMERMPYSLTQRGPLAISGVGNYVLKVLSNQTKEGEHLFTIYFLDSGAYMDDTKTEYDYIQQDQLDWLQSVSASFADSKAGKPNAMAFFHIPIWEYHVPKGSGLYPKLGDERESVSSPREGAVQALEAFKAAGDIRVTGCGHNHVNDYCLERDGIQLCYGGGLGVGGYGAGHLGWPRRARVWEIVNWGSSIRTWKRLHDGRLTMIDFQTLL